MLQRLVFSLGLVASALHAQRTVPQLRLTEELRIRGEQEDLSGRGRIVAVARDGRLVVFNEPRAEFVFFSAAGKRIGAFGRSGTGPGEFAAFVGVAYNFRVGFVGDTLWVFSVFDRRFAYIGPDLRLVRATAMPLIDLPGFQGFTPRAVLDGGRMLGYLTVSRPQSSRGPGARGVSETALAILSEDGRVERRIGGVNLDTVAPQPPRGARPTTPAPLTVGTRTERGIAGDGNQIAIVTTTHTAADTAGSIVLLRSAGDTVYNRAYSEIPAPVFYVYVGYDSAVWVRGVEDFSRPASFFAYDRSGAVIGRVTMPTPSLVVGVAESTVWATEFDSNGFIDLIRYRIARER